MAKYSVSNSTAGGVGASQPIATTYKTLCAVYASTTGTTSLVRRGKVYDILIGTNGVPADNYMQFCISTLTSPSTSSLVTSNALDQADATAASGTIANSTTEGTFTSSGERFFIGINQRASYRWVAAPGSEIVWPAVSSAGYALRALSGGYTGTATGQMLFEEQ